MKMTLHNIAQYIVFTDVYIYCLIIVHKLILNIPHERVAKTALLQFLQSMKLLEHEFGQCG